MIIPPTPDPRIPPRPIESHARLQPDIPQSGPGLTRRARRAVFATSATASSGTQGLSTSDADVELIELTDAASHAAGTPIAGQVAAETVVALMSAQRPRSRRELREMLAVSAPDDTVATVEDRPAASVPVAPAPARVDALRLEAAAFDTAQPEDDAFERAARTFRFTGQIPVLTTSPRPEATHTHAPVADAEDDVRAPAPEATGSSFGRRLAAASFTIGVMGAVGMLTVAMGAPAEAVAAAVKSEPVTSIQAPAREDVEDVQIQAFVAPDGVDVGVDREGAQYSMMSLSEVAAANGITRHTNFFVNDPSGEIQWPFAVGVPISYGYGPRWGSYHYGLDFTPGDGAEIQAVAAGTVRVANESGGAFGVHVMIDHEINGEVFSTHYAHMQYGSLRVQPGDVVQPGTILGLTGDTGLSYGAHLHFEVYINGTRIDPLAWLRTHAGG